jgi:hemoglobin
MNKTIKKNNDPDNWMPGVISVLGILVLAIFFGIPAGCGTQKQSQQKNDFFTSGSKEADQRASQRMAKEEQLSGSGDGDSEKGAKKAVAVAANSGNSTAVASTNRPSSPTASGPSDETNPPAVQTQLTTKAAQVEGKLALFDRLGGEAGISAIVDDVTPRMLHDPRVNFERKGVKKSLLSIGSSEDEKPEWTASSGNVTNLKKHLVQFFVLATGGPSNYDGKEMTSAHAKLRIGNPEFDAALGDLKASLDRLQIPNKEQKELLSIVESTRPEIVSQR